MATDNKALEYTKDIVVAALTNKTAGPSKKYGEEVAAFAEEIYKKFKELESKKSV